MEDQSLFRLPGNIQTRWASAENLNAERGAGGKANFGRKGSAWVDLDPGETFVMASAEGAGTVRRMWITINDRSPEMLRGIVLRMYWDGEEKPAVEAPIGDFFCQSLGRTATFENAWFDNPEGRSFNCRIPMPFRKGFKITATNESPDYLFMFFYDVNFTLGDEHGPDVGYFHAHFRRENPTKLRRDFEILPKVTGRGRFLGCTLGAIADTRKYARTWWGEGEVKMYMDGDTDYPTLCGTGTEDYIGTGWGQGQYSMMWHGCPIADHERMQFSFYRFHGPDPIYFQSDIRVTIQQIGHDTNAAKIDLLKTTCKEGLIAAGDGSLVLTPEMLDSDEDIWLFEREDDWSAVAYFYLDRPANNLPAIQPYEERGIGGLAEND